jgi:DNA-directed RNA polymerase subunit RPC12/RpoP
MIVFCEDCGERYIIEEQEIWGDMTFNCSKCGFFIKVTPPPNICASSQEVK